jgi:hypothetical protein
VTSSVIAVLMNLFIKGALKVSHLQGPPLLHSKTACENGALLALWAVVFFSLKML